MKLVLLTAGLLAFSFLLHSHCEAHNQALSPERIHDDLVLRTQISTLSRLNEENYRAKLSEELKNSYQNIVPPFQEVTAEDFNLSREWAWYPTAYGFHRFKNKASLKWGHLDVGSEKILNLKLDPIVRPSSKLVIVVHGYLDHLGCSSNFYESLVNVGLSVVAFDLPGHGYSSGTPGSIKDFSEYAETLAALVKYFEKDYSEIILAGFSTGASTIMEAQRLGLVSPHLRKVFISPLVRVAYYWILEPSFKAAYFARTEWNWSVLDFAVSPRRWVNSNSHDPLFLEFLQKDPLSPLIVPGAWTDAYIRFADRNKIWLEGLTSQERAKLGDLLVLQGDADGVVDAHGNVAFLKAQLPQAEVVWYRGAGHQLS